MYTTIVLSFLLLFTPTSGFTDFSEGQKLQADGKVIDIKVGHLVPCVVDWNNDGLKDLMVGQFNKGMIRLYLNEGTDSEPLFTGFEYLKAGGKEISLPAG